MPVVDFATYFNDIEKDKLDFAKIKDAVESNDCFLIYNHSSYAKRYNFLGTHLMPKYQFTLPGKLAYRVWKENLKIPQTDFTDELCEKLLVGLYVYADFVAVKHESYITDLQIALGVRKYIDLFFVKDDEPYKYRNVDIESDDFVRLLHHERLEYVTHHIPYMGTVNYKVRLSKNWYRSFEIVLQSLTVDLTKEKFFEFLKKDYPHLMEEYYETVYMHFYNKQREGKILKKFVPKKNRKSGPHKQHKSKYDKYLEMPCEEALIRIKTEIKDKVIRCRVRKRIIAHELEKSK